MSDPVFGPWAGLPPLRAEGEGWPEVRARWLAGLAGSLYGPIPPPPDRFSVDRYPCGPAERLVITLNVAGRTAEVDALLWLPEGADGPCPIIAGLDFLGPYGLPDVPFPPDPDAIVCAPAALGGERQRLTEGMRGQTGHRWPVRALHEAGFGLLLSCYGSWVPDDPVAWRSGGIAPLVQAETGAISLWAWAYHRLIDVAFDLGIGPKVVLAGHSRLGKAALWAGATDPRAAAVFANASGCAGAAPAAHGVDETLADLIARYPHWLRDGAGLPEGIDQHHLLAAIPGAVALTSARGDLWADPVGSYRALVAASGEDWPAAEAMWSDGGTIRRGRQCHGLRQGGHDLTRADWDNVLPFLIGALS